MADLFNAGQLASVSHFPASLRVPALQFAQSLPVRSSFLGFSGLLFVLFFRFLFSRSRLICLLLRAQVGLDMFCMLMCFIAAIPLGFVHARLPSATVKHVYSTVLGLAFGYLLVGAGVLHSLATCLVTYVR